MTHSLCSSRPYTPARRPSPLFTSNQVMQRAVIHGHVPSELALEWQEMETLPPQSSAVWGRLCSSI